MGVAPILAYEAQRLATLLCLHLLDTPTEERLERITRIVAAHFAVPIAAINLVGGECIWSQAAHQVGWQELPRQISLWADVAFADEMVIVADATIDTRFRDNPLVIGSPHLRFYAGVPLRNPEGYVLGSLCITDTRPRTLSANEIDHLRAFANWAERELTTEQLSEALLRQQEIEDALRLSEDRYATVLASLSEGIVVQDAEGRIVTCNASAERILDRSRDEMMERRIEDLRWHVIHEDGSPFPNEEHPAMVALRTGTPCAQVVMGVHRLDGSLTWISVNSHPLRRPGAPAPYGVVSSFVDITQHKAYAEQLRAYQLQLERHNAALTVLATTDGLTGVANRRTMLERLAAELELARRTRSPLSLVMIDVDHFKAYNDSFGHLAGDDVLKQVARLLQNNARSTDLVARYGGEEFALVLPNTDADGARHVAERCRAAIARTTFPYRGVTASFGVAAAHGEPITCDELIARADEALYAAKVRGRNKVVAQLAEAVGIG